MNTKLKIAIAAGTTLVIGIGGYLIYRSVVKKNEAARNYLNGVDESENGTPNELGQGSSKPFKKNTMVNRAVKTKISDAILRSV